MGVSFSPSISSVLAGTFSDISQLKEREDDSGRDVSIVSRTGDTQIFHTSHLTLFMICATLTMYSSFIY